MNCLQYRMDQIVLKTGPSPGFSSRGGPKTRRRGQKPKEGATFLKYCIGCMQQPGGQTWNGGHRFQMGGTGTTGHPAGDDPASKCQLQVYMLIEMAKTLCVSITRQFCSTFRHAWRIMCHDNAITCHSVSSVAAENFYENWTACWKHMYKIST